MAASGTSKRRNLKEYYGVVEQPAAPVRLLDPLENRRADPLDLDHPAFNAELYLNKFLFEVSLPDLMQRDNDLVTEIKELDGDMKTLVYENYSKFISATETIRRMKANVDDMDVKVNKLAASIDKIDFKSQKINDSLTEQRSKITQLSGVHNLLKKLNFVFELPDRLQQCLKRNELDQAVRYYSKTYGVLAHYGHLTMFKKIADESYAIMQNVGKKVNAVLVNPSSNLDQISSCIGMIIGLANQPSTDVAKLYINTATPLFKKILDSTEEKIKLQLSKLDAQPASSVDTPLSVTEMFGENVELLISNVLLPLSSFIRSFDTFFIIGEKPLSLTKTISTTPRATSFQACMNIEDYQTTKINLDAFICTIVERFFYHLIGVLFKTPVDVYSISTEMYLTGFRSIQSNICAMPELNEHTKMQHKVDDFLDEWISGIVCYVFEASLEDFLNGVNKLDGPSLDEELLKNSKNLSLILQESLIKKCLPFIEILVASRTISKVPVPALLLLLSKTSLLISQTAIQAVYRSFGESLFSLEPLVSPTYRKNPQNISTTKAESSDHEIIVLSRIASVTTKECSQHFIQSFVNLISYDFSAGTRVYFDASEAQWLLLDLETACIPSDVMTRFVAELKRLDHLVNQVYPDDGILERKRGKRDQAIGGNTHTSRLPVGQFDNLLIGIDKLFAEKIVFFGIVDPATRGSILTSILKACVKSFIEEVRMLTLSPCGVAQLHADLDFFRKSVYQYSVDDRVMTTLFDEVNASVQRRSIEQ